MLVYLILLLYFLTAISQFVVMKLGSMFQETEQWVALGPFLTYPDIF